MVFCYKLITESPRRELSPLFRRKSPLKTYPLTKPMPSEISELMRTVDYGAEISRDVIDLIPEKDWRLLVALARKRDEDEERDRLAEDFKKLWKKEDEERKLAETEIAQEYQQYINLKRSQENRALQNKRRQRLIDHQIQRGQLIDCIKHKELRSAGVLAYVDDRKARELFEKALVEEGRAELAARRRARLNAVEEFRRRMEMDMVRRRVDDARQRRGAKLRDDAHRVAINNALNSWEVTLLREENLAMDSAKRASLLDHLAHQDAKCMRLARNRDWRKKKNRQIAVAAARMREDLLPNKFGWS